MSYWFQGNFAAVFALIYRLRECSLSAVTNLFELMCQLRQLLPLFCKMCPSCCKHYFFSFLPDSGVLLTWGRGNHGRLGHGDNEDQYEPKRVRQRSHDAGTFENGEKCDG